MLRAIPQTASTPPPVYYVAAWLWARGSGDGEIGLRSLSALAGVATIPVAYVAGGHPDRPWTHYSLPSSWPLFDTGLRSTVAAVKRSLESPPRGKLRLGLPLTVVGGTWREVTRVAHREPVLVALLAFAAAFFAYRWAVYLDRPQIGGSQQPEGWQTFHDQSYYLLEAKQLGELRRLPQEIFLYGPGYPILGAPFANFGRFGWPFEDPFLIGNAAIWLLTVSAAYLVGRRLYGEVGGVGAALALMLATPLIEYVVIPWNSTATLGALMVTALVALERTPGWWHGAILGVAVAWAYSARYVDALWVAIAVIAILLARGTFARREFTVLAATIVAGIVAVAPTLMLQWNAFGSPFRTSYSTAAVNPVTAQNFDRANIGPHALQTFFSPWFFEEDGVSSRTEPLLSSMFLIVLAPVGYLLLLKASTRARRTLVVGYGLASLAATLFYLAYYFTGSKGLTYGAQHFFKMWWPLWTIAAVGAVASALAGLSQRRSVGTWRAPKQ